MRTLVTASLAFVLCGAACGDPSAATPQPQPAAAPTKSGSDIPPLDPDNIVSIAVGSKDHTTLVAALKAANYVTSVANPGPLTVFAPTNAAFDKLPAGTVDGLLKPEKLDDLKNVLKYHVAPATFEVPALKDGMELGMANGKRARIRHRDGKILINDATITASIRASNGIVHVVDGVLLPPAN
ncbi:MAG: fasciclin domain-containing protein [Planctomycetes bacterium]|nr:fasciclin domain-containing protein [Planctomycetota bacterium]